jgi:hypothetical protein
MSLQYIGVNLSGLEFGSGIGSINTTYTMPAENNYSYWSQEGSNIVRLPFTWERLQPQANGPLDQNYLSYLKSSVAYAQAHGETIILDMHNYGLYNGQPATGAQLSNVWTQLGQVFNGNSSVWFDLMNEPNNVSATQWENVEQQAVNAMRADGINNKLLLEGTAWSGAWTWVTSGNAAAFSNFKDPANNYAFDVHQYLDSDGSGTSATAVPGSGSTRLVDITNWAESTGQKLFLGEAGLANNAGSETEMKAMIQYMGQHAGTWLGMTLWGAGPWWGSNYIYNVNPTGLGTTNVANAQDINDLHSYLTPGSSGTSPTPSPSPSPSPSGTPVANADDFNGQQYHSVAGNVLGNNGHGADSDPSGLALSVAATQLTTAHGGTVALNADGTFTYNPAASFYGADSFTYTLKDSAGLTATGTVNVNVNAAPVAHPDDFTGTVNTAIAGNVLADNGHGADSDPVAATLGTAAANLTTAHGGHVNLAADGSFTYTPASGYSGTDSFNYTLLDGRGGQANGTASITLNTSPTPTSTGTTPTPSPSPAPSGTPVANADDFNGQQYHSVAGNVLGNNGHGADSDPNGLALSVAAAQLTTAHGGTVALNADGTFNYNPAASFYGADSFSYTLKDSAGLTATGTVNVNVNAAPVAHPDDFTGTANAAISGNVLADNGHGADSDPVAAILGTAAANLTTAHGGHVSLATDGSFTYTPASGYTGTDSFNYALLDGRGGQADGTASILLNPASTTGPAPTPTPTPSSYTFTGTAGADTLYGDSTHDSVLHGLGGNDKLYGGSGNDTLYADAGNNLLHGGNGNDMLYAGSGTDKLYGDAGNDLLVGGTGTGTTTMTGGTGADAFQLSDIHKYEIITDFKTTQGDKVDLSQLLQGVNPLQNSINSFIHATQSGASVVLSVDTDGTANGSHFVNVATLQNVHAFDVLTALHNGTLVA